MANKQAKNNYQVSEKDLQIIRKYVQKMYDYEPESGAGPVLKIIDKYLK